jgi:hypothetical protein
MTASRQARVAEKCTDLQNSVRLTGMEEITWETLAQMETQH